jgi:hypothetical protein
MGWPLVIRMRCCLTRSRGQDGIDLLGRVPDQGLVAVEEDAAGPGREHDAGTRPKGVEPARLVLLGQRVLEPPGRDAPDRRSRNMTASVMVWLKRFMKAWWLSADSYGTSWAWASGWFSMPSSA